MFYKRAIRENSPCVRKLIIIFGTENKCNDHNVLSLNDSKLGALDFHNLHKK